MMLEIELPLLRGLDLAYVHKIKQLLLIIESVPFIPNVSKLSTKIGIENYFAFVFFIWMKLVFINLFKESGGISKLQKPLKVYLENSNLMYALTSSAAIPEI
jgi:hypothetical protein